MALFKVQWFVYVALLYWPFWLRRPTSVCVTKDALVVAGVTLFDAWDVAIFDGQSVRVPLYDVQNWTVKNSCLVVQYRSPRFKTVTLLLPHDAQLEAALQNALS